MIEQAGRTIIGSIMFIDIVRYSEAPNSLQLAMKARLNAVIGEAVAAVAAQERVILDTGDGAAICFIGDPEDALFAATAINEAIRKTTGDAAQELRTGMNLGPIKLVTDLNGWTNVVGDGVNVAQRIMSFAEIGEILVSRSFYEVVARLREGNDASVPLHGQQARQARPRAPAVRLRPAFRRAGVWPAGERRRCTSRALQSRQTGTTGSIAGTLPAALLIAEERRLAAYIGPLARVIVQAGGGVRGLGRRALPRDRRSDPGRCRSCLLSRRDTGRGAAARRRRRGPHGRQEPAPAAVGPSGELKLSEAELSAAEHRLARYIGPLAGVLVKKAARAATDRRDFYARLGASIANQTDRAAFLAAVTA